MADQAPQATLKANCRRMVVLYGIVAEVMGPSYTDLQVRTYYVSFPTEFQPEFLSPEFWTKLILPWNDLIPTCVPTESRNVAEFLGFQKMTPGRNPNRKQNAHPRRTARTTLALAISHHQGRFNNQQGREAVTEGSGVGAEGSAMMQRWAWRMTTTGAAAVAQAATVGGSRSSSPPPPSTSRNNGG